MPSHPHDCSAKPGLTGQRCIQHQQDAALDVIMSKDLWADALDHVVVQAFVVVHTTQRSFLLVRQVFHELLRRVGFADVERGIL